MRGMLTSGFFLLTFLALPTFSDQGLVAITAAVSGELHENDEYHGTPGAGIQGILQLGTSSWLTLTARSGYVHYFREGGTAAANLIPVMGGIKFPFQEIHLYLTGEIGAAFTHLEAGTVTGAQDYTGPAWALGLGSEIGPLDLRLSFNVLDMRGNSGTAKTIGMMLGIRLWDNL